MVTNDHTILQNDTAYQLKPDDNRQKKSLLLSRSGTLIEDLFNWASQLERN